jgi:hypothetical protein
MKNMAIVIMFLVSGSTFAFGGLGGLGSMNLSGASNLSNTSNAEETKLEQEEKKKKRKTRISHSLIEGKKISFYKKK